MPETFVLKNVKNKLRLLIVVDKPVQKRKSYDTKLLMRKGGNINSVVCDKSKLFISRVQNKVRKLQRKGAGGCCLKIRQKYNQKRTLKN